jgi:hypothetical protein
MIIIFFAASVPAFFESIIPLIELNYLLKGTFNYPAIKVGFASCSYL